MPGTNGKTIRMLLGKLGTDGHSRGVIVLAKMLREAGLEIIYTGLYQTPEMIVKAAIEEDVDVVGLSYLTWEHLFWTPQVTALLKKNEKDEVLVIVGGAIPEKDIHQLESMGVNKVLMTDTPIDVIVDYINSRVTK